MSGTIGGQESSSGSGVRSCASGSGDSVRPRTGRSGEGVRSRASGSAEGVRTSARKPVARATKGSRKKSPTPTDVVKGHLRAQNPFELIRWIAFSQTDPRKAVAELVQNSLDAGAGRIRVTRIRRRGIPCLRVFDNGQGVIPEMDRPEALRYIATHIGHSRKRSLSPQERLGLMTQGRYGIGLLGFWCLGEVMEMRSAVPGHKPYRLILYRDRPNYRIEPLHGRLPLDELWTEIVVSGLGPEATRVLLGRRAADYLASELRGQLLAREVDLVVEDRMSRGRAQKTIRVRPPRFLGERLEGIGPVEVPDHPPIRMEIYYTGDNREDGGSGGLAVYAAGTLVAAGFHELTALGLDHPPWTDPRLTGLVDFPGLLVAPGSRRGIVPDEAAESFAQAMASVEPVLTRLLEGFDQRRVQELDRALIRDLQRAFRDFYRHRPTYSMLPVKTEKDLGAGPGGGSGAGGQVGAGEEWGPGEADREGAGAGDETSAADESAHRDFEPLPVGDLLPPGPLVSVRISPGVLRLECGASRRAKAQALDATNRPVEHPVTFTWALVGPVGRLVTAKTGEDSAGEVVSREGAPGKGASGGLTNRSPLHSISSTGQIVMSPEGPECDVKVVAAPEPAEGTLAVRAVSGDREARAEIPVEVLEMLPKKGSSEGIPEPELLDLPAELWRSRMLEHRWQVNSGHRDYLALADQPTLKLRYLALLFAKEVVLRNYQDPRLDRPLEQLVEVMTYADQRLSSRGQRRKRGGPGPKG